MAKGLGGITLFKDSVQVATENKSNGYSASINISEQSNINFSEDPDAPGGVKNFFGQKTGFPFDYIPVGVPTEVPTQVPLQEYLLWLPTAKKALALALVATAVGKAKQEIGKKVKK